MAAILAKPLLWACMDEVWRDYIPAGLRSQIFNQLAEDEAVLNMLPEVNMVDWVLCIMSKYEGLVTFTEVNTEYDTLERRAVAISRSGVEWQNIMIGKVCMIENKVHDIQNNHARHYQDVLKKLEKMDKNLTRLLVMPVQQIRPKRVEGGGGSSNESEVVHPANLCSCPKNLYVLWAEHESGVAGSKPARLFNRAERGKV